MAQKVNHEEAEVSQPGSKRFPWMKYIVVCTIASILVLMVSLITIDGTQTTFDATQNKILAFNVAKHGVYSISVDDMPDVSPTLAREPLYPYYLAGLLRLFTDIDEIPYECFSPEGECVSTRLLLNRASIPFYIGLVWLFTAAAYKIIRSWVFVVVGLVMLFSVDYFYYFVTLTELPAAFFLLFHAFFLYLSASNPATIRHRYIYAALSAVGLAALILTKAIFLYWLPILGVGSVLFCLWRYLRRDSERALHYVFLSLVAVAIIMPWLIRNYSVFGELKIAGRDSGVLALRAEYSYLSIEEYFSGFLLYSTPFVRLNILPIFFEPEDYIWMQRTVDRDVNPDSYYYLFASQTGRVAERAMERYGSVNEEAISAAALSIIRENWLQHLALTLLFGWRGSFIDGEVGTFIVHIIKEKWYLDNIYPWYYRYITALGPIMSLAVPCMLGVALRSLWKRRWSLLLFLLPALYSFGIYAFITHYIPRYSSPLVPIWIIAMGLVGKACINYIRNRRQQAPVA